MPAKKSKRSSSKKSTGSRKAKSALMAPIAEETQQLRRFAEESPLRATAAAVVASMAVAGLVGTKAGRTLLKTSAGLALPLFTKWAGGKAVETVANELKS